MTKAETWGQTCTIEPASSLQDFLFLRTVRNANLRFLEDGRRVSLIRQLRFYFRRPQGMEIFVARHSGQRAAYLVLYDREGETFITEVVDARFRRLRLAASLVQFAKERRGSLVARIRHDNKASISLHEKMGFRFAQTQGRLLTYRWTRS